MAILFCRCRLAGGGFAGLSFIPILVLEFLDLVCTFFFFACFSRGIHINVSCHVFNRKCESVFIVARPGQIVATLSYPIGVAAAYRSKCLCSAKSSWTNCHAALENVLRFLTLPCHPMSCRFACNKQMGNTGSCGCHGQRRSLKC